MAKKPTIVNVASGYQSTTTINDNLNNLRNAFDNTLSLDGSTPNAMQADLDMNSYNVINANVIDASTISMNGIAVVTDNIPYLGDSATNPATRLNGDPLETGDLYFNTTNDRMRVYEIGTGWIDYEATAQTAATTATTQAGIATTQAGIATTQASAALASATTASTKAGEAATSATASASARDAAIIGAGVYVDEATGRAAVADGVAFKVQGTGNIAAYEYRRVNAGSSTLIATYPSLAALTSRENDINNLQYYMGLGTPLSIATISAGSVSPSIYRLLTPVNGVKYRYRARFQSSGIKYVQIINSSATTNAAVNVIYDSVTKVLTTTIGTATAKEMGGGVVQLDVLSDTVSTAAGSNAQLRLSETGLFPWTAAGTETKNLISFEVFVDGTTTNLFASSSPADASFTKASCTVAIGNGTEDLLGEQALKADTLDAFIFGSQIASNFAEGSGSTSATIYRNVTVSAGQTFDFTVVAKKKQRKRMNLISVGFAVFDAVFNLETGVCSGTGSPTMEYLGGGYWECRVSGTVVTGGGTNQQIRIYSDTNNTLPRTGDGVSGIAVYSAEFRADSTTVWKSLDFTVASWIQAGITPTSNAEIYGDIISDLTPSVTSTTHPFTGKKVAIIGTSITAQNYYTTALANQTGAIIQNLGSSGGSLASGSHYGSLAITNQIPSIATDSNYVLIEAGINDFGTSNSTIGVLGDTTTATFYGALYNAAVAIMARAPSAKIAYLTPYSAASSNADSKHFWTNGKGYNLRQFQNAVKEVANLLAIQVFDVGGESNIGYLTGATYMYDGLHINDAGGFAMSSYIAGKAMEAKDQGYF